ncbi:MAG: YlxR family protein [Cyanobacteria bacterium RM1_2_2]|nr:YlxR family protein [Cyanobacteria bacterium RM1_2_2]
MLPNHRRCISCRKVDHKSAFWRVVRVFSSHQVQLDQGMGRSVYLCPQESCLQAAQKKDRLGRSLKTAVPEEIYQTLWQRLTPSPGAAPKADLDQIYGAAKERQGMG